MSVIQKSEARDAKREEHAEVAKVAFEKLHKLSIYKEFTKQDVYDHVMCHPQGRKQFLFYCAESRTWRVDRLDHWKYYHVLALVRLHDTNKLAGK
jgi:hypothetical protein